MSRIWRLERKPNDEPRKSALRRCRIARAMPLRREAQMAVANLRQYGADPDCVPRPGIDDNAAQQHWFQTRSRLTKKRVPLKPELAGTLENGAGHRR